MKLYCTGWQLFDSEGINWFIHKESANRNHKSNLYDLNNGIFEKVYRFDVNVSSMENAEEEIRIVWETLTSEEFDN